MNKEILTDIDKEIKFLSKQYIWNLSKLKNNENIISLRMKLGIIFFISFLYSWVSIVVATMQIFQNAIIKILFSVFFIGVNIYVYSVFYELYIKDVENKNTRLLDEIDSITKELDKKLDYLNIDKDSYYKELVSKVVK